MRHANSWALAPASRVLFNKNKVALSDLKAHWPKNVVYICERENGNPVFLSSCGGLRDVVVGTCKAGHNNYTFASLGYLRAVNIVEMDNGVVIKSANDQYLGDKAPIYAFK